MQYAEQNYLEFTSILPLCDGFSSRLTGEQNPLKEEQNPQFFDAISGYVVCAFGYFVVGVAAYHSSNLFGEYQYIFIIMGALASITDIYARLIYQKYTCIRLKIAQSESRAYELENDNFEKEVKPTGFTYYRLVFDRQTGISALFMPALIISFIFSRFEYMTFFYCLYHCAALSFIFYSYLKKASKL